MFHYVSSKQELFFCVYDYFDDLMKREYFELMDYGEKDIFNRLRQSYTLQIGLLEKYSWITEFHKLSQITHSDEINKEISNRKQIPSHGTNRFGTRYAYDFIQVDWNRGGYPAYRVSFIQYLLFGVKLENYYCWGQDVYAPLRVITLL